jgi:hypothetical protein
MGTEWGESEWNHLPVFKEDPDTLLDSWGRGRPMIIGGIGMVIAMMLIGVIMKTKGGSNIHLST